MRLLPLTCVLALLAAPVLAIEMPPDEGGEVETPATPQPAKKIVAPNPAPVPGEEDKPRSEYDTVILQGLDKVTGRISKLSAILEQPVNFGNLEITAHRCWQASPEDRPENAALLEIHEIKAGEEPTSVFSGWMFSSSPGLSALEHPVYDITVLACAAQPVKKAPVKPAAEPAKKPAVKPAAKPSAPVRKATP